MTTYKVHYDQSHEKYDNADDDELLDTLDRLGWLVGPSGHTILAQAGPEDGPWAIRFGINHDAKRGMVQWLEDGSFACDPALEKLDHYLFFDLYSGGELAGYNGSRTLVTPEQVRQAVRCYVQTGERPGTVEWASI